LNADASIPRGANIFDVVHEKWQEIQRRWDVSIEPTNLDGSPVSNADKDEDIPPTGSSKYVPETPNFEPDPPQPSSTPESATDPTEEDVPVEHSVPQPVTPEPNQRSESDDDTGGKDDDSGGKE